MSRSTVVLDSELETEGRQRRVPVPLSIGPELYVADESGLYYHVSRGRIAHLKNLTTPYLPNCTLKAAVASLESLAESPSSRPRGKPALPSSLRTKSEA